jgi:CheY-like chemotaxis protein
LGHDDVVTASNGLVALDEIDNAAVPFDVIICDLNMPEMDGIAFMRHAADRKVSAGMILLSGEDERMLETAKDLAAAHNLNILGVIPKPLKPDTLSNLLNTLQPATAAKQSNWHQKGISETELINGMDSDQLLLVYQPKVSIATGEMDAPGKGPLGPRGIYPPRRGNRTYRRPNLRHLQKGHAASRRLASPRHCYESIGQHISQFFYG